MVGIVQLKRGEHRLELRPASILNAQRRQAINLLTYGWARPKPTTCQVLFHGDGSKTFMEEQWADRGFRVRQKRL